MKHSNAIEVVIRFVLEFHFEKTIHDDLTRLGYVVKKVHKMGLAYRIFPLAADVTRL